MRVYDSCLRDWFSFKLFSPPPFLTQFSPIYDPLTASINRTTKLTEWPKNSYSKMSMIKLDLYVGNSRSRPSKIYPQIENTLNSIDHCNFSNNFETPTNQ